MLQLLKPGISLTSPTGNIYEVESLLGAGSQGEVYRVTYNKTDWALKWYFDHQASDEQYEAINSLIRKGSPNSKFLWPIEIVKLSSTLGFGYIMPLREPRFKSIIDLMKGRIDPPFSILVKAAYELVNSYKKLHSEGLCYKDISFGNVFFDPNNGEVRICDNDNVRVDKQTAGTIEGTPRFMAPEIVRGEAKPSTDTDLFSLAVLLFYMFTISHPLEGKRETAIHALDSLAMKKLYGDEPIFIFDPINQSNRPDPSVHTCATAYWNIYPDFFQNLFIRSFTEGLHNPEQGRVRESEWRDQLKRLEDMICYCSGCGSQNFIDPNSFSNQISGSNICWNCKKKYSIPPQIFINNHFIYLHHQRCLYQHHIDGTSYDFENIIAKIINHPSNPNIWGLKNCSDKNWIIIRKDGTKADIGPGKTIALQNSLIIDFGQVKGQITT